jgi:hypothetical protein
MDKVLPFLVLQNIKSPKNVSDSLEKIVSVLNHLIEMNEVEITVVKFNNNM